MSKEFQNLGAILCVRDLSEGYIKKLLWYPDDVAALSSVNIFSNKHKYNRYSNQISENDDGPFRCMRIEELVNVSETYDPDQQILLRHLLDKHENRVPISLKFTDGMDMVAAITHNANKRNAVHPIRYVSALNDIPNIELIKTALTDASYTKLNNSRYTFEAHGDNRIIRDTKTGVEFADFGDSDLDFNITHTFSNVCDASFMILEFLVDLGDYLALAESRTEVKAKDGSRRPSPLADTLINLLESKLQLTENTITNIHFEHGYERTMLHVTSGSIHICGYKHADDVDWVFFVDKRVVILNDEELEREVQIYHNKMDMRMRDRLANALNEKFIK